MESRQKVDAHGSSVSKSLWNRIRYVAGSENGWLILNATRVLPTLVELEETLLVVNGINR
jgi:hypothetical protein